MTFVDYGCNVIDHSVVLKWEKRRRRWGRRSGDMVLRGTLLLDALLLCHPYFVHFLRDLWIHCDLCPWLKPVAFFRWLKALSVSRWTDTTHRRSSKIWYTLKKRSCWMVFKNNNNEIVYISRYLRGMYRAWSHFYEDGRVETRETKPDVKMQLVCALMNTNCNVKG